MLLLLALVAAAWATSPIQHLPKVDTPKLLLKVPIFKEVQIVKPWTWLYSPGPPAIKGQVVQPWLHYHMTCPQNTFAKYNGYCYTDEDCGGSKCYKAFGEVKFPPLPEKEDEESRELLKEIEDYKLWAELPLHKKKGLCCVPKAIHKFPSNCPSGHETMESSSGAPSYCGVEFNSCPPQGNCYYGKHPNANYVTFGRCCVPGNAKLGPKNVLLVDTQGDVNTGAKGINADLKSVAGSEGVVDHGNSVDTGKSFYYYKRGSYHRRSGSKFRRGREHTVHRPGFHSSSKSFQSGSKFSESSGSFSSFGK